MIQKLFHWPVRNALFLFAIALSCGLLMYYFSNFIFDPNAYNFVGGGDGIKNYFSYAYHTKFDKSNLHFEGVNYPFGEHVSFVDGQPLVTNLFRFFGLNAIGWLHSLLFLSFPVATAMLFLFLKREGMNAYLNVIFSVSIPFFSPQIYGLSSHHAMAYVCFIPSILLALQAAEKSYRYRDFLLLFLLPILWFYVHPYLGITSLFFIGFYYTFKLLTRLKSAAWKKQLKQLFIPVLSLLACLTIQYFTDYHVGRTKNPYGFFTGIAYYDSYLVPKHSYFVATFASVFGYGENGFWRGGSHYIGTLTLMLLVIGLVKNIFSFSKIPQNLARFQGLLVISALFMAFISIGSPFIWGFEWLLDYLGPFKQFRTLERFGTVTVYVALIIGGLVLNGILKNYSTNKVAVGFLSLSIFILLAFDFNPVMKSVRQSLNSTKTPNVFDKKGVPKTIGYLVDKINPSAYSSVLALPYFHGNSEIFDLHSCSASARNGYIFSFHTGLPLMNSDISRTSFAETKLAINILTPPYSDKSIKSYFPNKKDILVILTGKSFSYEEDMLLANCEFIAEKDEIRLYKISHKKLLYAQKVPIEKIKSEWIQPALANFWISDSSTYYFDSFDATKDYKLPKKRDNILFHSPTGFFTPGKYYVSLWMHYNLKNRMDPILDIHVYDRKNDTIDFSYVGARLSCRAIENDWLLVQAHFSISNDSSDVEIIFSDHLTKKPNLVIDNLLIRKSNTHILHNGFNKPNYGYFLDNHIVGKMDDQELDKMNAYPKYPTRK